MKKPPGTPNAGPCKKGNNLELGKEGEEKTPDMPRRTLGKWTQSTRDKEGWAEKPASSTTSHLVGV